MPGAQTVDSPLTDQDRQLLKAYSRGGHFWETLSVAFWPIAIITAVLYFGAYYIWVWFIPFGNPRKYDDWILWAALLPALWWTRSIWLDAFGIGRKQGPDPFAQDLAGGIARTLTAGVTRVVEIEEYEDEGLGFFLELDDGRVLALVSQDLYEFGHDFEYEEGDDDRRDPFPQDRIEYRYAPLSGLNLECKGIGEPLKPIGTVTTAKHHFVKDRKTGAHDYIGAEDGAFYEGSLEEVLERLKYKLEPL